MSWKKKNVALRAFSWALVLCFLWTAQVWGSAAEEYRRGVDFGRHYADQIRINVDRMKERAALRGADMEEALRAAGASEALYEKILPSKVAWMKGAAEGSGASYQDILLFNTVDRALRGFEGECTTFVANGKALASGKGTIVAKNRDLGADTVSEIGLHHPSRHPADALYKAAYIDLPQVEETFKFVGSRSAGRWGYGMGVNEHQVVVADNDAPTREKLAFKEGLHDNDYVRLILERARTAREGVEVLATITEKYGQAWNAIMFEIGDPEEVWVVEVAGYRWVAKKYDDTVTVRTNQLQIQDDYDLASEDLVSFARENGWVEEGKDRIDFRAVYGTYDLYPSDNENFAQRPAVEKLFNTERRYQRGMELLQAAEGNVTPQKIIPMMRDHYDTYTLPGGKALEMNQMPFYSSEHADLQEWVGKWPEKDTTEHPLYVRAICHHGMGGVTAASGIMVARPDVPDQLGLMLHSYRQPCLGTFVPFYVGIDSVPEAYGTPEAGSKFLKIGKTALGSHSLYHGPVRKVFDPFEAKLFPEMEGVEKEFTDMARAGNEEKAEAFLTDYVRTVCAEVLDLADKAWESAVEAAAESSSWSR